MASFLLVVVVYKKSFAASPTLTSLQHALTSMASASEFALFVHDNSPEPQNVPAIFPIPLGYRHDASNPGLAVAYNTALERAAAQGIPWLVLLDDDTALTSAYLEELAAMHGESRADVLVPRIFAATRPLSPNRVRFARVTPAPNDQQGIADFEVNAINSGSAVRTQVMQQLGGFNQSFPLDFLDYWLFHALHRAGARVWLGRSALQHGLSVLDYEQNVSFARYQSILTAEARFTARYKSVPERFAYRLRLLARALKQLVKLSDKRFARLTLRAVFSRLD